MTTAAPPLALLAELTHRCPLQCPYCSNPLELERASTELDTTSWRRVLTEAARLGVLQVHFSGGEPLVRRDLGSLCAMQRKPASTAISSLRAFSWTVSAWWPSPNQGLSMCN